MVDQRLKAVRWFAGLSEEDLERICQGVEDVHLGRGEYLFHEGDEGDRAYVIASGEVEILKETGRREVVVAVRSANDVIGETSLLHDAPRNASVRARSDTEFLAIPRTVLEALLSTSPTAARVIVKTVLDRDEEMDDRLKQTERMAQLGTLTAGIAHELNNPAAAVKRGAQRIQDVGEALLEIAATPPRDPQGRVLALGVLGQLSAHPPAPLGAMERGDVEDEVADWLADRGVGDGPRLAATLVESGIRPDHLASLSDLDAATVADAATFLAAAADLVGLAEAVSEGARRLSGIVGALKSHIYLDQAPEQDVDVRRGIEDTLVILGHKTKMVEVVREFADDLPLITAYGGELNQVWTNLIDNACDAMNGIEGRTPTLTLRARRERDDIVVEVEDNGPGIPAEIREKIFDAFFTTKAVGEGTGLGLQISYRIVTLDHRGELTVDSEPGRTTFRVRLPVVAPTDT